MGKGQKGDRDSSHVWGGSDPLFVLSLYSLYKLNKKKVDIGYQKSQDWEV